MSIVTPPAISRRGGEALPFLKTSFSVPYKRRWKIPILPTPFHVSPISFLPLALLLIGGRYFMISHRPSPGKSIRSLCNYDNLAGPIRRKFWDSRKGRYFERFIDCELERTKLPIWELGKRTHDAHWLGVIPRSNLVVWIRGNTTFCENNGE